MNRSYRTGWHVFRTLFRLYFRWEIAHADRVPLSGPVILASNHASFIDPPLVGAALPRDIHYLARASLFRYPPLKQLLPGWNAVPVDRDGGSGQGLRAILERLKTGSGIIIFPEGTRSRDGSLGTGHTGVGLIITKSTAPVVPVRIFGSFQAMGRHHLFPRPKKVGVTFGTPRDFASLRQEARQANRTQLKKVYQTISSQLMQAIAELEPPWPSQTR